MLYAHIHVGRIEYFVSRPSMCFKLPDTIELLTVLVFYVKLSPPTLITTSVVFTSPPLFLLIWYSAFPAVNYILAQFK
jgi:hypothetical protein